MKLRIMAPALAVATVLMLPVSAQVAKLKVLHNFGATGDGSVPSGPLALDSKGNLYGVTTGGGAGCTGGCGTVFELSPRASTWNENILYSFTAGSGGAYPWGGLLVASPAQLYGAVEGYLSYAVGGVFELSHTSSGWSNTILYDVYSGPGLVFDKVGNLYGTMGGGSTSYGAIGELSPGSGGWTYAQLYSFCPQWPCPGGYNQPAPPIWDASGNLWGTMTEGGINQSPCFTSDGCGVIFEMTPNGDGTWTYNIMHQFASSSTDGQWPYGSLVMDAAGNFYGSTWLGGTYNHGTIFKFSNVGGTWQETILYNFPNCTHGCMVEGTLAMDTAGNLYGTADGGAGTPSCGGAACGVVFKLAPQTGGKWKYSVLYNLNQNTGGVPSLYGVILDGKGNLYGVTSAFGKYGAGTAFEITP